MLDGGIALETADVDPSLFVESIEERHLVAIMFEQGRQSFLAFGQHALVLPPQRSLSAVGANGGLSEQRIQEEREQPGSVRAKAPFHIRHDRCEGCRRRDGHDHLKTALKDSKVTEDENRRANEQIQKLTDKHIADIDALVHNKEKEIMEV